MDQQQPTEQKQINIKIKDEDLAGKYSNMMQVAHTKEEFILDFMNVVPPQGILSSRIIISPGHMKRIIRALQDNLQKYEYSFGEIEEAGPPQKIDFNDVK